MVIRPESARNGWACGRIRGANLRAAQRIHLLCRAKTNLDVRSVRRTQHADWYLTVRDNDWCDAAGRPPGPTSTTPAAPVPDDVAPTPATGGGQASERLQQLASEPNVALGYATRMSLPANHKPAANPVPTSFHSQADAAASILKSIGDHETNGVFVSSAPLGEPVRAS